MSVAGWEHKMMMNSKREEAKERERQKVLQDIADEALRSMSNKPRVECDHGQLKRSCNICVLLDEITELRASYVSQINKLLERDVQVVELRTKLESLTIASKAAIPEMICTCSGKITCSCHVKTTCARCHLVEELEEPK